jgi:chromatin remodeling complex protein RSC6
LSSFELPATTDEGSSQFERGQTKELKKDPPSDVAAECFPRRLKTRIIMSETTQEKRKPNSAFAKPVQPDEKLAAVVGADPLPRTELTKKVWEYIKTKGLQDSVDKRKINADENLRLVFDGKAQVNMFEMTKLINGHLK